MRPVEIYQIAYSEETLAGIEPAYRVLNNLQNPRPDWREYFPIRSFLLSGDIQENCLLGVFSPKFPLKTGLKYAQVIDFIQSSAPDTEVFTFSPQPDMGALFLNVFEQNEWFDPGFIAASEQFLDAIGLPHNLANLVMDSRQIVFSNYFVASPRFWKEWFNITEQIFRICEGEDSGLKRQLTHVTTHLGVQRKVFLVERIASLLITLNSNWKVNSYNTFACAWSNSCFNQYALEAVLSDALKIAMREQGFGQYREAFSKVRDVLRGDRVSSNAQEFMIARDVTNSAIALAQQDAMDWVQLSDTTERLIDAGLREQAINLYQVWLAHNQSPVVFVVWFNLAVALADTSALADAEHAYRQAIGFKPDFVHAHLNLGTLLERQERKEEALSQWRFILKFAAYELPADKSLYVMTLNNLGRLLEIIKQFQEAEQMIERSLVLDPQQPAALQHWVHLRQKQCEWPVYKPLNGVSHEDVLLATSPLAMLSESNDPRLQLTVAQNFVKNRVNTQVQPLSGGKRWEHSKLRVGYFSSDFSLHPVSLLTAELFELHDRQNVEVYGFCWSPEDGSALRKRVERAMDHFVRIADMSDEEAARCIQSHEIDVLIDLQGLTAGSRPNVLSYRPAPVQITYLGFPGTTALPSIDYVIADRFVLPENLASFFTEKPLYMPQVFQVSDRQRKVGVRPSRADCGLPEDVFVFCSFNNNYKFTAAVFEVWMRILHRVPDSVLWLLADNPWAQTNLQATAAEHGVAPDRLVFAPRVAPADYLARYQLADLFLDTFPFNAGTTANDALWMAVPILTIAGNTFASRMAGSLLQAVGLPELITTGLQDYEDAAVSLAQDKSKVVALKQHLQKCRENAPLFNTRQFVRDLETQLMKLAPK